MLKLSINGVDIVMRDSAYKDIMVSNCPAEFLINGEHLKSRCYLNDCRECYTKALEERGVTVEIIHR